MSVRNKLNIKGPALVFVTTTVKDWYPVFTKSSLAEAVIEQLVETTAYFSISIVGYVLMPSHLHALLGFPVVGQLSRFMQAFKSLSSRKVKSLIDDGTLSQFESDGQYRLWMPRYDDLVVYSEKQFKTKLEYIHNNPVRAGLAEKSTDWPYSSAIDWLTDLEGEVPIVKDYKWMKG